MIFFVSYIYSNDQVNTPKKNLFPMGTLHVIVHSVLKKWKNSAISQNFWDPYNLIRLPELPSKISSFWLYATYIFVDKHFKY